MPHLSRTFARFSRQKFIESHHNSTKSWVLQGWQPVRTLTNQEVRNKRCLIYDQEKLRQESLIRRIEKIQVIRKGPTEDLTLIMNKNLSTPYNCAMHDNEIYMDQSILALVNGKPWDMHRPLVEDCQLDFLHFRDDNPLACNKAYWRSCSFILGHVLETAFKSRHYVELCSFPAPNVKSGSFVYDVDLKLDKWRPSSGELIALTQIATGLMAEELRFQRLDVDASLAVDMFKDNQYKSQQIPAIAAKSETGNNVTLYRVKDHIDISNGPMISNTSQIGRYSIVGVNPIDTPDYGCLFRIQGLSTPKQLWVDWWTWDILLERAAKLNKSTYPSLIGFESRQSLPDTVKDNRS
ncbi:large ribosomal subunit protein mL39-like [Tubulanus polymorphus]|uniref:large ribosomal subunit protein mL39-like n=1 Tax=Tubulanus polymorphus TaxID=672921 RepID=UPI003DA33301